MTSLHRVPNCLDQLPDLVARAWGRSLSVLDESHTSFIDRVQWVSETFQRLFEWSHIEVITDEQNAAMFRILRSRLERDLGHIADVNGLSARLLPPAAAALAVDAFDHRRSPAPDEGALDPLGSPGCRGGTPAHMGHGRPALAPVPGPQVPVPVSAVGPAPVAADGPDITFPADPLLLALQVQELPWNIQSFNNRPHGTEEAL